MKFTDRFILNLKPEVKIVDIREGEGFGVRILPSGIKTFFFIYRKDGKRRFLNLGHYDQNAVSGERGTLAYARKLYTAAKKKFDDGIDPLAEKEQTKEERRLAPTVADLTEEYIEKHAMREKKSWAEDKRALDVEVIPTWGKIKAKDIRKRDVVLLLEGVIKRGSPVMANRLRALLSKMFNFGVDRDIIEMNPCAGIKPLASEKPRERALTEDEIRTLWVALDDDALVMSQGIKRALRLILVTGQRPGEVAGLHSREIDGQWWTIPSERSKNGKSHRVFLTDTALDLIGSGKEYAFPSAIPA